MKTAELKSRTVELDDSWDVVVAGGGPAGCAAAIASAREGMKTLLVEATGALGGMGTSGLVPAWCPFTDHEKIIYRGIAEKVLRATIHAMPHLPADRYDWTPIDPEALKRIYDEMVTDSGATLLFNTMVAGVEKDGCGGADSLVLCNKKGLTMVKAGVYVDCTGDADVAVWAGSAYEKGGEDGELQPATHCFTLSNVDTYSYEYVGGIRYCRGHEAINDILASGKYPEIVDSHACNSLIGPGVVGFNAGHVWDVDSTDPYSVSRGLVKGRRIAKAFRDACAEFCPAFANAHLTQTAPVIGTRESRRIVGDYVLTEDDYVARRTFDDEICRNCYYIDIHRKKQQKNVSEAAEGEKIKRRYGKGESHGVPYRSLLPKGVRNVIVAGRTISTDRVMQGSTRVMPVCLCMGEAAGIAAAMARTSCGGDVHAVDVQALREKLRSFGAYLP